MPDALHFLNHPNELVAGVARGYASGGFLMDMGNGPQWFGTERRAVLPLTELAGLHVPRRLKRTLGRFEVRRNTAYAEVVQGCRGRLEGTREREDGEWISPELAAVYGELHAAGLAHSFEVWQGGKLAGGIMGLSLGGVFFAESKFHRVSNASKVALVRLTEHLHKRGFTLLDVQVVNDHTAQFGVTELDEEVFAAELMEALTVDAEF